MFKEKNQSYQGETINPNGSELARCLLRYNRIRGPQQFRRLLGTWGLLPDKKQGKA